MAEAADAPLPRKIPPPRLDHFLSIRVSQFPQVLKAIETVQASITSTAPSAYKGSFVEPITAHLTLGVLALNGNQERLDKTITALDNAADILRQHDLLQPFNLNLQGLSHFRDSVLYLGIQEQDDGGFHQLNKVSELLRTYLIEQGCMDLDKNKEFNPHITIAKTSKLVWMNSSNNRHRKKKWGNNDQQRQNNNARTSTDNIDEPNKSDTNGKTTESNVSTFNNNKEANINLRKLPRESWQDHIDIDAGIVTVNEIQLCSMLDRKPGEFYNVVRTLKLVQ